MVSDPLWHGLYSPWNSPGQNTGVGSLSLLQRIFPTQGSNPGRLHCRWILDQLSHQGSPRILEWVAYPFSGDLPDPGIEPGSPVLQVNSLPIELSGKSPDSKTGDFQSLCSWPFCYTVSMSEGTSQITLALISCMTLTRKVNIPQLVLWLINILPFQGITVNIRKSQLMSKYSVSLKCHINVSYFTVTITGQSNCLHN